MNENAQPAGPRGVATACVAAAIVVAALAAAAVPWEQPFRLDDYVLIPRTGMLLGVEPWTPTPDEAGWRASGLCSEEGGARDVIGKFFRPVAWVLWRGVLALSGGVATPGPFRALSAALHAACALALYALLRRAGRLPISAAACGALLFAVHPGGRQAFSWVSATSDLCMTLGALLAALAAARAKLTGGGAANVAAFAACLFGGLSKEGLPFLLPGVLVAYLAAPGAFRICAASRTAVACVAGYAGSLVVRRLALGTWTFSHFADVGFAQASLSTTLTAFWQALVPISRHPHFAGASFPATDLGLFVWRTGALLLLAAPFYKAWSGRAWRTIAGLGFCILATLVPAAILSAGMPPEARQSAALSRSFYPTVALFGACVAVGWTAWPRVPAIYGGLALVAALLAARGAVADESRAAAETLAAVATIDAALAEVGPDGAVVVIGEPMEPDGVPRLHHAVEAAFAPPFRLHGADRLFWVADRASLRRRPALADVSGKIVVLEGESRGFPRLDEVPLQLAALRPPPAPRLDARTENPEDPVLVVTVPADGPEPTGAAAGPVVAWRLELVLFDETPRAVAAVAVLPAAAFAPRPNASASGSRSSLSEAAFPLRIASFAAARFESDFPITPFESALAALRARGSSTTTALLRATALDAAQRPLGRTRFLRGPFRVDGP